jgi:hypothetical protein
MACPTGKPLLALIETVADHGIVIVSGDTYGLALLVFVAIVAQNSLPTTENSE